MVRRSAADREDLKPFWKSAKRPHFSIGQGDQQCYTSASKDFTAPLKEDFPQINIINTTGATNETFQQSGK